jgi:hypothetical protein
MSGRGGLPRPRPDQQPAQQTVPLSPTGLTLAQYLKANPLTAAQLEALGLPEQTASYIATGSITPLAPGGTPLLHGQSVVYQATGVTVPAAGATTIGPFTFTKPAYLISILTSISASATVPFCTFRMQWYDPTATYFADEQDWTLACDSDSNLTFSGKGPVRGGGLFITMVNQDPAEAASFNILLMENTDAIARDDWRQSAGSPWVSVNVPGWDYAPGSNPQQDVMLTAAPVVTATPVTYLLPLYSGEVWVAAISTNLVDFAIRIYPYDDVNAPIYYSGTGIDGIGFQAALPRMPCGMQLDSTGSSNVQLSVMVLEYAS